MSLRNGGYSFLLPRVALGRVLLPFSAFLDSGLHLSVLVFGPECKFNERGE